MSRSLSKKIGISVGIIIVLALGIVILFRITIKQPTEKNGISEPYKSFNDIAKEKRTEFFNNIENHYQALMQYFDDKQYNAALRVCKLFEEYKKLDYENVKDIYIKTLEALVKPMPVTAAYYNLRYYKELLRLDPNNKKYGEKVSFYAKKVQQEEHESNVLSDFRNALKIEKFSWTIGGFGGVAKWKVLVKNVSSKHSFKDIKFKTKYWAESGTMIDESVFGHTEYTLIKPKSEKWIDFQEFCHSQSTKASVTIIKAERVD